MMHSWQTLLLLISVPLLIFSVLSFLGQVVQQLIRLLPYVFLTVFGFGGVAAIIDSSNRSGVLGGLELLIGTFTTLVVLLNLYLIISNHQQNTAILNGRNPRTRIQNIVTDKIEKPSFTDPNNTQESIRNKVSNKLKFVKVKPTKSHSIKTESKIFQVLHHNGNNSES